MRRIHQSLLTFGLGIVLLMSPLSWPVKSVGGLITFAGLIYVLYALRNMEFEERIAILSPSFWIGLGGFILFGLVHFPPSQFTARIGEMIESPWVVAVSVALVSTALYTGTAVLIWSVFSVGNSIRSSDDGGPGPDES